MPAMSCKYFAARHAAIVQVDLHTVAIELQFMHEAPTARHAGSQGREAGFDEAGERRRFCAWKNAGEEARG
jgi:hypothetical protein